MTVTADRTHLYNMLSNLIGNAIKYSGEKTCHITLKGTVSSQEMTLSVTDEGIGISEANQKRVFDKFYRVPSGNLHDVKGFGLGLYYVSDMMSKHNGSVTVKSQLGKGSTFTLHFKN
jgi:signal transduction histidine kinase